MTILLLSLSLYFSVAINVVIKPRVCLLQWFHCPYIDIKTATDYLMTAFFRSNECVSKGNQAFLLIKWFPASLRTH